MRIEPLMLNNQLNYYVLWRQDLEQQLCVRRRRQHLAKLRAVRRDDWVLPDNHPDREQLRPGNRSSCQWRPAAMELVEKFPTFFENHE